MATAKLESLPKEIIAHIAILVEARSILALCQTSRTIRGACYDSLLFKQALQRSQQLNWRDDSLDLAAIERQAGGNTSIWASYAVADDHAWILAGMKNPLQSRRRSAAFLPELAVVKHPFLKQSCWHTATHGPFDYLTSHVFGLTMAVLSATKINLSRFHDPDQCEYCFPRPRANDPAFLSGEGSLWTLCSIITTLRDGFERLKARGYMRPFLQAFDIPFIVWPRANNIPLQPVCEDYALPRPFTNNAMDLLNKWSSVSSGWNEWYGQHNYALFKSRDFLTEGLWCGYITANDRNMQLDPPAMDIRFTRCDEKNEAGVESASIAADECVDSHGTFSLQGSISWDGNAVTVALNKFYVGSSGGREWDCRLTPFGIVGHWGMALDGRFSTFGYVWLWKEAWTSDPEEQGWE